MPSTDADRARAALARWLDGEHPWLTLVGPPGIGKRRWLERALAELAPDAPLSIRADDAPNPARHARTIVISHRRHHHPEETVIELGPLPRPAAIVHAVESAQRAGVALTEDEATALVARVGGHRQALDLLVRRLTVLTLPELLARLDAPPHAGRDPLIHAAVPPWDALRRALDDIVSAIDEADRATLAAAALFGGRFTVSDLSRICGGDRLPAVQRLRDRCLVARCGSHGGLHLLPVIQRYARAHLPTPCAAIVGRHYRWRCELAAEWATLARRGALDGVDGIAAVEAELRALVDALAAREPDVAHDSDDTPDGFDIIPNGFDDTPDDSDGIPDGSDDMPDDSADLDWARAGCDAALALAALYEHRRSADSQRRVAERAAARVAALDRGRRVAAHVAAARASRLAGDPEAAQAWLDRVAHLAGPDVSAAPADRFAWCHERCALASLRGERDAGPRLAEATLTAARAVADPVLEARALINLGVVRHGLHDLDGAVEAYSAARHISRRIGATRLLSISALNVCLADVWRGQLDAARAAGEEARAAFVAVGDRRGEGAALNNLGMIALDRGDLDAAEACFIAAERCHAAIGFRQHAAYARLNRAEVALERGQRARHDALIAELELTNAGHPDATAVPGPGPLHDRALSLHLSRSRARSALLAGDLATAAEALDLGRARMGAVSVPAEEFELQALRVEVALARGDLAEAQAAWTRAEAAATDERRGARQRVELLALAIDPPVDPLSDGAARLAEGLRAGEASLAIRRTLRAVWHTQPRAARREARARLADAPALCLDPQTHELRLPDGRWVSLERRRLVWTLLEVLFDAPDALSPDGVIAAVWPGEVIQPDAASNRLYNAVALLRKAGLGQWLERVDAGYRLAPALRRLRVQNADLARPD